MHINNKIDLVDFLYILEKLERELSLRFGCASRKGLLHLHHASFTRVICSVTFVELVEQQKLVKVAWKKCAPHFKIQGHTYVISLTTCVFYLGWIPTSNHLS